MPLQEARLYQRAEGMSVSCGLCNHRCTIQDGKTGICGVRRNTAGRLWATTYGLVSAEAVDPIEKKPLYHYLPGSLCYSLGSVGCNFRCAHCQNWQISQTSPDDCQLREILPEEGVRRALRAGCRSIAWTYNEPTIWHEYALAMGGHARKEGLGTVYVTNGYMTADALRELSPVLSAFRVDIKAFRDEFYRHVCGARLEPVLESAVTARELGMHIETVTLLIPGQNDSPEETGDLIRWVIENLGPDTPMHFTRFHPDYKAREIPATPVATLERVYQQAKDLGLRFPFTGNVPGHHGEHTWCPACGALLIERRGYSTNIRGLDGKTCRSCGEQVALVIAEG